MADRDPGPLVASREGPLRFTVDQFLAIGADVWGDRKVELRRGEILFELNPPCRRVVPFGQPLDLAPLVTAPLTIPADA